LWPPWPCPATSEFSGRLQRALLNWVARLSKRSVERKEHPFSFFGVRSGTEQVPRKLPPPEKHGFDDLIGIELRFDRRIREGDIFTLLSIST